MGSTQSNSSLDTFAWLIYQEVEAYVNENLAEYEEWLSAHNLVDTGQQTVGE